MHARHPALITVRVGDWVGNLRESRHFRVVRHGLLVAAERNGLRVVHFSVQRDHLHLIVEVDDGRALSAGMKGLQVRLARALNRLVGRRGRVFVDRYHARVLTSPREVRHALIYVLNNRRKHARKERVAVPAAGVDPCSSGAAFDGWADPPPRRDRALDARLPAPKTWLLRTGWRLGGLVWTSTAPG